MQIERRDIGVFSQFAKKPEASIRSFISDFFKNEIEGLVSQDERRSYTDLYHRLYSLAVDSGLRRDHEFAGKKVEAVPMLNRQAFLYELRKRAGVCNDSSNRSFKILNFDIAGLRELDRLGSADYNLNIFARELNEILEQIREKFREQGNRDFLVGRYGGDEFSFALIGDFDSEQLDEIKRLILEGINSLQMLVNSNGQERPFALKNNTIEEISIPSDENKRRIFFSFLKRGIVLNDRDLEKEINYFTKNGSLDNEALDNYLNKISSSQQPFDLEERIKNLLEVHPQLKVAFYYAEIQDLQANDKNKTRQRQILEFVENYLFDPLLQDIVISRFDLIDHIKRGFFKKIYAFELKIKEVNDYLSQAYGDELIIHLWLNQLKSIMDPFIKQGLVSLGRIGGTVFFAIKESSVDNKELQQVLSQLENINEIVLQYKDQTINHTVGFAEIDIDEFIKSQRPVEAIIGEMSVRTTSSWLERRFIRLFNDQNNFDLFIKYLENYLKDVDDGNISMPYDIFLLIKYFTGARFKERIKHAIEILTRLDDKNILAKKGQFIELLNQIKNKKEE